MNSFVDVAEHFVLTATPGATAARTQILSTISVSFPDDAPSLMGKPSLARYRSLSRYMAGFDLVLTYNWGAMDAVGARRLFPANQPPLIHHEDGFNADEAVQLNWKRNAFRRLMLPTAHALVVPSQRLAGIARDVWGQGARTHLIPNGIATAAYTAPPAPDSIPGFVRHSGDIVVGTLAGLRQVKNLPRLIRAVAAMPPHVRLVIVGEGPERGAILAEAARVGLTDRLLLPGFLPDPARVVGHFDIFALSSDSEQAPISLIEAMAAGKPSVSMDVGDVANMVAPANRPFIAVDEAAFTAALSALVADADVRARIGAANAVHAAATFDEGAMLGAYARLYAGAMGIDPARLWPAA